MENLDTIKFFYSQCENLRQENLKMRLLLLEIYFCLTKPVGDRIIDCMTTQKIKEAIELPLEMKC